MPHNPQSLRLTDAYRRRLLFLGERVERQAKEAWPRIEHLDSIPWPEHMARQLTRTQIDGVRLTAGYIGAFLRSETGRGTAPALDSRRYAGLSRDGRPLLDALQSPLIGVRAALKEGKPPSTALAIGLHRATRMTKFEAVQAPRDALLDAIEADERLAGWQRNVAGTCAACMAFSGASGPRFEVHPGCQCVPMPTVTGVTQTVALPTGAALFSALSKQEQERAVGAEAAALVRDGQADLKDFVSHSKLESDQPDFITQRPVQDVAT